MKNDQRIAIVADWITATGGAERVILALKQVFPNADIYTSTYESGAGALFHGISIHTSWLQKLPKPLRKHQLLTIPRQWYFGHLRLRGYDIVISAGSNEAKAVRAPDGKHIHICYTPSLQYWIKTDEYVHGTGSMSINPLWRSGLQILLPYAKRWDLKASTRPDVWIAISSTVQKRITDVYGRDSQIIHPAADIERFTHAPSKKRDGFIIFGRHVAHKRFDLAIAACNEIGARLTVVGSGPETSRLKAMAGPTITFVGRVDDAHMVEYLARAEAFIFPNEEDFGIVAVEAQAAGLPVIAYRGGGALDTVEEGVTGEFFDEQTVACLSAALSSFNYKLYNRSAILAQADKFSYDVFRTAIQEVVVKSTK